MQAIERSGYHWEYVGSVKNVPMAMATSCGVYAVEIGQAVKIGYSKKIGRRVRNLDHNDRHYGHGGLGRVALSCEIHLPKTAEKLLHKRFADKRISGEMFNVSIEEVGAALAQLPPCEPDWAAMDDRRKRSVAYCVSVAESFLRRQFSINGETPENSEAAIKQIVDAAYFEISANSGPEMLGFTQVSIEGLIWRFVEDMTSGDERRKNKHNFSIRHFLLFGRQDLTPIDDPRLDVLLFTPSDAAVAHG